MEQLPFEACMHACIECAAACDECVLRISSNQNESEACLMLSLECAEMCRSLATLLYNAVQQITNDTLLQVKNISEICVETCDACATECAKHHDDHCRRCLKACRRCADVCRTLITAIRLRAAGSNATFLH
ncbi:four-helix bundle copper-binding protein [Noviherbaspirillum agri]